jgi:hypothetical protein
MKGETMSEISLNQNQLKEILKAAIVEVLQENREEFSELLAKALEDIGLQRAISEGESTELVSRETIFKILGSSLWMLPLEKASRKI